jgi:hypothetical protein
MLFGPTDGMDLRMADGAQRDEVLFCIATQLTAMLLMMDLEIGTGTTTLAAPTIALEHLLLQLWILVRRQSQTTGLGKAHVPLNS